jgi:hypothetical protein
MTDFFVQLLTEILDRCDERVWWMKSLIEKSRQKYHRLRVIASDSPDDLVVK